MDSYCPPGYPAFPPPSRHGEGSTGDKINGLDDPPLKSGTAIATFNDKGTYGTDKGGHAAIFVGYKTDDNGQKGMEVLEQSDDHLAKVVAARGGIWKEAADGRTVEAIFPEKGARYRIRFAKDTGLSREISEIGPLPSERSDFIFAIQRRFGAYELKPWKGNDDIQVEYGGGYENGQPLAPLEMPFGGHGRP